MGRMNNLDLELREISQTSQEYEENKIMLTIYLLTANPDVLSLKLKGFWRDYLQKYPEKREQLQTKTICMKS